MDIVLLSQHPELLIECAELLNKQWKRSTSARVQSLEKSFTSLPDSLLLVEDNSNFKKVIGHSRLTRVLEDPNGCWIGSVVISEDERKKGYGKYLMKKTEEYARVLQFSTAYLNTHDQQGFYEHLGYSYCEPVSSVNFTWNIKIHQENFSVATKNIVAKSPENCYNEAENEKNDNIDLQIPTPSPSMPPPVPITNKNLAITSEKNDIDLQTSIPSFVSPPIPPPPPIANKNLTINNNLRSNLGQYWMKKKL